MASLPPQVPQQQQAQQESKEEQEQKQSEFKNQILSQILDQSARARLTTLTIAKPQKGAQLESLLINMARMGQLRSKLNEEELIALLEKVGQQGEGKGSKVKFDRRRNNMDSDDEEDYDL